MLSDSWLSGQLRPIRPPFKMSSVSMSSTGSPPRQKMLFHPQAYLFLSEALRVAQEQLGREDEADETSESGHISGPELLDGVRLLGLRQFGMMAPSVFHHWGIRSTGDFGRLVFELIERGQMRKTDRDQLSDFFDVYDFQNVFVDDYRVDLRKFTAK